jgi:hypothetical protein
MKFPNERTLDVIRTNPVSTALFLGIVVCAFDAPLHAQTAQPSTTNAKRPAKSLWTIGIYTGPSPFQLSPAPHVRNPVLRGNNVADMNADTLAHPFLIIANSRYYAFFTAKDHTSDKGGIGLAESSDGFDWKFRKTVIREPFVTAHPFVFQWENEYYMIPETHTEPAIRLYKATSFPDEWKYQGDLLTGETFLGPTLVRYKDLWWMFTSRPKNETLRLFFASDVKGPWTEHPLSPIVKKDLATAKPGGRPFVYDGKLYRLGQDSSKIYGYQVRAFEITEISPTTYSEKMIDTALVKATSTGWNAQAMHHVDAQQTGAHEWIALVDALGK